MSVTHPAEKRRKRVVKAVTEPMRVEEMAGPGLMRVVTIKDTYRCDISREKGCTCGDFQHRDVQCKHHIRARIEAGMVPIMPKTTGLDTLSDQGEAIVPDTPSMETDGGEDDAVAATTATPANERLG